jgi:hypothetical protein
VLKDELYRAVVSELIRRVEKRMLPVIKEGEPSRATAETAAPSPVETVESGGERAARRRGAV